MTAPSDRVIINHPDGRSYSVTRKAFEKLYEPEGFSVSGPETAESFKHDAPTKPARAGARRKATRSRS